MNCHALNCTEKKKRAMEFSDSVKRTSFIWKPYLHHELLTRFFCFAACFAAISSVYPNNPKNSRAPKNLRMYMVVYM